MGVHQIRVGVSPVSQDSGKPQHMGSQCPRSMLRLSDLSGRRGLESGIVWGSLRRAGACQSRLPGQLELVKQEGQRSPAPGRPHTIWAHTSLPPLLLTYTAQGHCAKCHGSQGEDKEGPIFYPLHTSMREEAEMSQFRGFDAKSNELRSIQSTELLEKARWPDTAVSAQFGSPEPGSLSQR